MFWKCRFLLAIKINMNHNSQLIPVDSLSLATFISLQYPIKQIDRTNPRHVIFYFDSSDGVNQLIESYWQDKSVVEPKLYFQQLKQIKSRIYGSY
jgi:hypothetical protein